MTFFDVEEIEIHIRTYRSLLKASGMVKISQLVDSHIAMGSILHEKAAVDEPDLAAFIYVLLRLPTSMSNIKTVILGQSYSVFKNNGFAKIHSWQEVEAPGRRRKMFFDGKDTLAIYIASVTDVDDIITLLTTFQIEWNKFHKLLSKMKNVLKKVETSLEKEDLSKIKKIWGGEYPNFIIALQKKLVDFTVKLISGSYVEYAKATQYWWKHIHHSLSQLKLNHRPVYFVSSNTHSLVNIISRFVIEEEKKLINFLFKSGDSELIRIWQQLEHGDFLATKENFLYYLAKKYAHQDPAILKRKKEKEKKLGIHLVPSYHYLDIDVQVMELDKLAQAPCFQLFNHQSLKLLEKSQAVIINIDYPLGWAAYQVLSEIGENVDNLRGIYLMGKSATLNGQIGDILIPSSTYDLHTRNTYVFTNCLSQADFLNIFKAGNILDHQKTICTKGTFLENKKLLREWYHENYSIIEMEEGPYLNAAYEFVYYNRYPEKEFVNLTKTPFEIGIAHYASDTPYSKAKNLGVRNLSYEGVEPTYAISRVILKKIFDKELKILGG